LRGRNGELHIILTKTLTGLVPADPKTEEWYRKIKLGSNIHSDFKQMRNAAFHRKMFALFNLAFEYWEPADINTKWGKPEKSFDNFRKNLTILAGHGHLVFNINGTYKMEADSLSFGSMSQEVFDELYQNIITVVMKKIPTLNKMTQDEIDNVVNRVLEFA